MGNCIKSSNNESSDELLYYRNITLSIKCKNYTEKIKILLNEPEKVEKKIFSYPSIDFYYSSCVIPGQDPRGEIEKVCQDNVFVTENKDCLLFGIFDGHGKHGAEVVKFCVDYMTSHFLERNFHNSPKENLNNLIEECDRSLLNESKIDCSTSGTTAVILYINQEGLWASSVGDSRAVLGTLPKYEKIIEHKIIENPYKKQIIPMRFLKSVQLTLDQKPNISYELERIMKAGGIVQQLSNSEGTKIGPYRI